MGWLAVVAAVALAAPPSAQVGAAALVSERDGWALTARRLAVTDDGGATWRTATPRGVDPTLVRAASFLDRRRGWLAVSRPGGVLRVYRTANGGRTWRFTPVGPPSPLFADATRGSAFFDFADPRHGVLSATVASSSAFSVARLFATSDGGATWRPLAVPVSGRVELAGGEMWVAGGVSTPRLYRSDDGGRTWRRVRFPRLALATPVFARGGRIGVLAATVDGRRPAVRWYVTRDAGARWTLARLVRVRGDYGVGVAAPTAVSRYGRGWIVAGRLPALADVLSFATARTGWAVAGGRLYATADGGVTWLRLTP